MELLQPFQVTFSQNILTTMSANFSFTSTKNGKTDSEATTVNLQVCLKPKCSLKFKRLQIFVEDIKFFLQPVQANLIYFTIHNSKVFQTFLNESIMSVKHTPQPCSTIEILGKALEDTKVFLHDLVEGKATYENILKSGLITEGRNEVGETCVKNMEDLSRERQLLQKFFNSLLVR